MLESSFFICDLRRSFGLSDFFDVDEILTGKTVGFVMSFWQHFEYEQLGI